MMHFPDSAVKREHLFHAISEVDRGTSDKVVVLVTGTCDFDNSFRNLKHKSLLFRWINAKQSECGIKNVVVWQGERRLDDQPLLKNVHRCKGPLRSDHQEVGTDDLTIDKFDAPPFLDNS